MNDKNCLCCSESFSEAAEDNNLGYDRLFCMKHRKYVDEEECCNEYN